MCQIRPDDFTGSLALRCELINIFNFLEAKSCISPATGEPSSSGYTPVYVETKEELMTSLGKLGSPSQQILRAKGSISSRIEAEDQPKLKFIVLCCKCHHSD